jgi:hypothetical protein
VAQKVVGSRPITRPKKAAGNFAWCFFDVNERVSKGAAEHPGALAETHHSPQNKAVTKVAVLFCE